MTDAIGIPEKIRVDQRDIDVLVGDICTKIENSGWYPEMIVGISRGGLIPGVMLSHYFDVPFFPLMWSTRDQKMRTSDSSLAEDAFNGKRILVVDDICDSGVTLQEIEADWNSAVPDEVEWGDNVKTACMHYRHGCFYNVDYVGSVIKGDEWIVYPWESWYQS